MFKLICDESAFQGSLPRRRALSVTVFPDGAGFGIFA